MPYGGQNVIQGSMADDDDCSQSSNMSVSAGSYDEDAQQTKMYGDDQNK